MIIREKFKSLIPPLTAEEFEQLEQNCLKDGIRDPLVVWDDGKGDCILIDGHNRYRIAQKHGLPYETIERDFYDEDEAVVWIIDNQIGKRNLQTFDTVVLQDKRRSVLAKEANARRHEGNAKGGKSDKKSCPSSQTRNEKRENSTDYKIAKAAGTSEDTVRKVRTINEKATPKTKQLVREGKLSINQAYNQVHPKKPDPVKQAMREHEEFQAKKQEEVVDFEDIQRDKANTKIIDLTMLEDVLKVFNAIDRFWVTYCQYDLSKLSSVIKDDEINIFLANCEKCKNVLASIEIAIRR